jgi:hypothetical protein
MKYSPRGTPLSIRLAAATGPVDTNGCQRWLLSLNPSGYGSIKYAGRTWNAHHLVLTTMLDRPLRPGMQALHICDHRWCVAEDHIYEGSPKQNVDDRVARGRSIHPRGVEHYEARLDAVKVRSIRKSAAKLKELASRYKVSVAAISKVKRRKSWAHI